MRYTVPQRVAKGESRPVKVYFRVGGIYENVRLTVRAGEELLLEKKKRRMAPGEMEYLELTPALMEKMEKGAVIAVEE